MSRTATVTATDGPAIELGHINPRHATNGGHILDDAQTDRAKEVGVLATDSDEAPENAQTQAERWNYPRNNVPKLAFVFVSFIVMGMNDAAIGVCISVLPIFQPLDQLADKSPIYSLSSRRYGPFQLLCLFGAY